MRLEIGCPESSVPVETQKVLRELVTPYDVTFSTKHHHRIRQRFSTITETANQIGKLFTLTTLTLLQSV